MSKSLVTVTPKFAIDKYGDAIAVDALKESSLVLSAEVSYLNHDVKNVVNIFPGKTTPLGTVTKIFMNKETEGKFMIEFDRPVVHSIIGDQSWESVAIAMVPQEMLKYQRP